MQAVLAPSPTRRRLAEAINFLVASDQAKKLIKDVRAVVADWDTRKVIYADELQPLNTLVEIGVTNQKALDAALELVERKRASVPKVKRAAYQGELMRQRRGRMAKAIELRELETGRRFTAEEKDTIGREIQARWQRERAAYIVEKGRLDFNGRNEVTREFWERIDRNLDINLDAARKKRSLI